MVVTLPSPILELQHAPLPCKVLRVKERAPTPCFPLFSIWTHIWNPLKSLGVRQALRNLKYKTWLVSQYNVSPTIMGQTSLKNFVIAKRWATLSTHVGHEQCRNPILRECEDETHTPKMGAWESSETLETL
jgi:hypothetical protein